MAICRKCGAKLVEGDKVCRQCGTPVRQYKATRRVSKTPPTSKSGASRGSYSKRQPSGGRSNRVLIPIIAIVLVAIVVIVVIAVAGNGSDGTPSGTTATPTPTSTPKPTSTPTPTPTPTPIPSIAGIGDTLSEYPWEITLHGVRYPETDEWGDPAPSGKQFVVVDVELDNISGDDQIFSTLLQMSVVDSDGFSADWNIMVETTGSIDGTVPSGGNLRGEMAYDCRNSVSYYELRIQPDFLESSVLVWRF